VWVLAERSDQTRVARLDLLQRQPPRLVHEVDEPEVPRAHHHHRLVGHVVPRSLLLAGAAGRLAEGVAHHRVLLVAARHLRHVDALERPLDEVVEPVAVALLERRALRLPVVGEDDDLVRSRRVLPGPLPAEGAAPHRSGGAWLEILSTVAPHEP
jgi:hypothetical protein